jgi:hypothetical protein
VRLRLHCDDPGVSSAGLEAAHDANLSGQAMKREEQAFQIQLCDFLELNGLLPVAVPNEGKRSAVAGYKMKRAGLRTGFPDLLIFDRRGLGWQVGDKRGLLCVAENKSAKGRHGADQVNWVNELGARGVPVFGPWKSIEDAVRDLARIDVVLKVRL